MRDGRDDVGAFGVQPGQRTGRVGERRAGPDPLGAGQSQDLREQQPGGGVDAVAVPVQQPPGRGIPLRRRVLLGRAVGGVGAQQVVEGVPAVRVLLHQMRGGQPVQHPPGRGGRRRTGQRRHGRGGDVRTRYQPEAAERAPRLVRQGRVGQVERGPYRGVRVALHGQRRDPVALRQTGHVGPQRPVPPLGQVGGRDAQRQRQPRAQPGQLRGGRRVTGRAFLPERLDQQVVRLRGAQHVEREQPGTVAGDQTGQPIPGSDQHQAARTARQQRTDLLRARRVVEQHQHPPVGEHTAVPRRGRLDVDRYLGVRHPQRGQELGQRVDGTQRVAAAVAAQVDIQLTVRVPRPHPVRPVHRERRLADPGRADDRHGATGQRVQHGEVPGPAGEVDDVGRQLRGYHPGRGGRGGGLGIGLVGEDRPLQLAQFGARLQAQLVDQTLPAAAVHLQGVGAPAGPVQRPHQLAAQPLPQRVLGDQAGQFGDELLVAAERQLVGQALLQRGQPLLVQRSRGRVDHPAGHARQRRPAPQCQRLAQRRDRRGEVTGRAAAPALVDELPVDPTRRR